MTETERNQIKGALLKCAEENENRSTLTGNIVISSLCKSAVERIAELEKELNKANEWHRVSDKLPEMDMFVYLWKEGKNFTLVARRHISYGQKEWVWDCMWGCGFIMSQSMGKDYWWKEIVLPSLPKESE